MPKETDVIEGSAVDRATSQETTPRSSADSAPTSNDGDWLSDFAITGRQGARTRTQGGRTCHKCNITFSYPSKLRLHNARKHSNGEFDCKAEGCTARFNSFAELRRHKGQAHPARHRCSECDQSFVRPTQLRDHIAAVHEGDKGVKCPIAGCGSVMERRRLKRHCDQFHSELRMAVASFFGTKATEQGRKKRRKDESEEESMFLNEGEEESSGREE